MKDYVTVGRKFGIMLYNIRIKEVENYNSPGKSNQEEKQKILTKLDNIWILEKGVKKQIEIID